MVHGYLLTACLMLGGVQVEVKTLSGPGGQGELVGIQPDALVIRTAEGEKSLPLPSLWDATVTPAGDTPSPVGKIGVELVDGSQLLASAYTAAAGTATLTIGSGPPLTLRTRLINSIRLRDHSGTPAIGKQWAEILAEKRATDVVVIRRQESLDHLEGVLGDVTPEAVSFEFEGDQLKVSRQKLDGFLYYHPTAESFPPRLCQLTDASGSRWNLKALALIEGQIELTSVAGVKLTYPVEQLRKLDFSSGNIVWLSDLEPASVERRPFVASRLPQPSLERLFQPRRDIGLTGRPLSLDGVTYAKGLALTSRTEIVYRLTDEFRQFHAVVGIDDNVRDGGHVQLVITGDDRELLSKTVTGREPSFPIDVDLQGVRRLKILVDFGKEMDIADHLDLCDARLTK